MNRTATRPIGLDAVRHVQVGGKPRRPPNWDTLTIGMTEADVRDGLRRRVINSAEAGAMLRAIRERRASKRVLS